MMLLTDLYELKTVLDIDPNNVSEDKLLNIFIELASEWIQDLIGRDLTKKERTEYYHGTGTKQITLKHRPVFETPVPVVELDESATFVNPHTMVYNQDFRLRRDGESGISESGILYRLNGYWPRRTMRQVGMLSPFLEKAFEAIRVTYTGGYSVDALPAKIRTACNLLAGRMRGIFPLSVELNSDNFEERSVGVVTHNKTRLLDLVRPLILPYRNWSW